MTRLGRNILLIFSATAAACISVMLTVDNWQWIAAALTIAGLAAAFVLSFRSAHDAREKVELMIEAMRNNDFSFHMQERQNPEIIKSLATISIIIKQQKTLAQQKENFYNLIINNVDTGILVIDEKGIVKLHNTALLRLLNMQVLINASHLDRAEPGLCETLLNMATGETRLLSLTFNGENKNISVNVTKIRLGGENLNIYILNDVYSVIDRKEVDAWIKLTRVLTHEIMNGIAPIRATSDELINGESTDPEHIRKGLEIILSTSEGLMKFTQSFRKFAAIPSPNLQLNYVSDIAGHAIALMKGYLDNTKVSVRINPDNLIIQSDKDLVTQIFTNLIKNAVEANAHNIKITACTAENESVIIDVTDDGDPIPEDCVKQIFVPFFTTKKDGSGIGLSVSRKIMNMHKGTMQLITRKGTKTFRLKFP